jgi:hypothetical protein
VRGVVNLKSPEAVVAENWGSSSCKWARRSCYISLGFEASLQLGALLRRWKLAKILPLKKPDKEDYTLLKVYQPISLLSTLSKILESVIATRISYMVEEHGLLPHNHFGARKRRSCEQALNILQERIYQAWRKGKVLSLLSFDVKSAYNDVFKDVLLYRLKQQRTPTILINWIDSFCSNCSATVSVNSYSSEAEDLHQPGLPQGSLLSLILYLFYNTDLVE